MVTVLKIVLEFHRASKHFLDFHKNLDISKYVFKIVPKYSKCFEFPGFLRNSKNFNDKVIHLGNLLRKENVRPTEVPSSVAILALINSLHVFTSFHTVLHTRSVLHTRGSLLVLVSLEEQSYGL